MHIDNFTDRFSNLSWYWNNCWRRGRNHNKCDLRRRSGLKSLCPQLPMTDSDLLNPRFTWERSLPSVTIRGNGNYTLITFCFFCLCWSSSIRSILDASLVNFVKTRHVFQPFTHNITLMTGIISQNSIDKSRRICRTTLEMSRPVVVPEGAVDSGCFFWSLAKCG